MFKSWRGYAAPIQTHWGSNDTHQRAPYGKLHLRSALCRGSPREDPYLNEPHPGGVAVQVTNPRDLPDLRLHLLAQCAPGGPLDRLSAVLGVSAPQVVNGTPIAEFEAHTEHYRLANAALWWVSADMSALIDRAAATLPPTTLTTDLMPDPFGFAVFARPLTGTAADTGAPMAIDALTWGVGAYTVAHRSSAAVGITPYRLLHPDGVIDNSPSEQPPGPGDIITVDGTPQYVVGSAPPGGMWMPAGHNNWAFGAETEDPSVPAFRADPIRMASMSEDRRWLAALWLLAAQPLAQSTTWRPNNKAKARRIAKAKLPSSSDVRLINVRHRASDGEREPHAQGGGRNYTKRWMVEGFWRQQACGPGWTEHRPVFVEAHVRGPKDKPLVVREAVKVVRGSQ